MKSATEYLDVLQQTYQQHANPAQAVSMAAYMRNQFPFYGIMAKERVALSRQVISELGRPNAETLKELVIRCFEAEQRELHYFVQDLVYPMLNKLDGSFLSIFESLIPKKSWWDTIDFLAPKLMGGLLLRFPEQLPVYAEKWIQDDNFWFQRSAILLQLHYKAKTDRALLRHCILICKDSKEFFVQKAIGWALREYSKKEAQWVIELIQQHQLARLSEREGLKWLKSKRPELF